MPVAFKGKDLNGTALSDIYDLPFNISFFTVANKAGGTVTLNVYVTDGSNDISIVPKDLQLSVGDLLEGNYEQLMDGGNQIKIVSNGTVDYFFTIENIKPI